MTYKSLQKLQFLFSNLVLRNIYKVIYKFSRPKTHKHNRRYWPYFQVERNLLGGLEKVYFKKQLIANNTVKSSNNYQTIMLVATGPSIQTYPTDIFTRSDIDYVGINGSISLEQIQFKYYVIIDHNFTQNRFDLVLKVLQSQCTFFTTPRCLDIILRRVEPENIQCQIKVIETITEGKVERLLGPRITADVQQNHFYVEDQKGFSQHTQDAVFEY